MSSEGASPPPKIEDSWCRCISPVEIWGTFKIVLIFSLESLHISFLAPQHFWARGFSHVSPNDKIATRGSHVLRYSGRNNGNGNVKSKGNGV